MSDLAAILSRVEAVGGSIETPMVDALTQAILKDPDGNIIEIMQA